MTPLIEIDNVSVRRGDRLALEHVTLAIGAGELWAVVGPNGAGKSTLLGAVSGSCPLACGRIRIAGQRLERLAPRDRARALALVGQEARDDVALEVRRVVELGRLPYLGRWGGLCERDRGVVDDALAATGCTALARRPLCSLSDGERQRVHLARALAQEPRIILMDEATAHLDLEHRHDTLRRVREFASAGRAALVVVHDLELAVRHATHLAVLSAGKLFSSGVPRAVLSSRLLEQVFRVRAEIVSAESEPFLHVFGPVSAAGTDTNGASP